nr:hypothetical protein [Tanacetum cinerariifolium]
TQDNTKTPSPKLQLSSPSAPNAPSKTPSTKYTSSSSIDYIPKSPTSSTSLSSNGYLNPPTSPHPRVSPPPPTQENASMYITLTFSPFTPLDVQFDTPSPSPPIIGHPIPWNLLKAHDFYSQVTVQTDDYGYLVISFFIQREFISLALAQFGQILKIPYNGQAVFTNEWDLASLEYSRETEGPYCIDLPTLGDIRRILELKHVVEELIRENVFRLGGHRDRLPACIAHMLYCVVAEEQYNLAYFFVKRIECAKATLTANLSYGMFLTRLYRYVMETYPHLDNGTYDIVERVMRHLTLRQTQRPRSDHGKARRFVSSSSSHHQGTSSHQHDDDDDVKTSRASTSSPTTYLNSLNPLDYQNYQIPSSSKQTDETLFAR